MDKILKKIYSSGSYYENDSIAYCSGLTPNRQQPTPSTNDDKVHLFHIASLGLNISRLRQNGCKLPYYIFKCILFNDNIPNFA